MRHGARPPTSTGEVQSSEVPVRNVGDSFATRMFRVVCALLCRPQHLRPAALPCGAVACANWIDEEDCRLVR